MERAAFYPVQAHAALRQSAHQCFRDLEGFVGSISSEHAVVVYVNLIPALGMAAGVIGLETRVI